MGVAFQAVFEKFRHSQALTPEVVQHAFNEGRHTWCAVRYDFLDQKFELVTPSQAASCMSGHPDSERFLATGCGASPNALYCVLTGEALAVALASLKRDCSGYGCGEQ